jgi:Putative prokaryotic signal transducing protein
VTEAEIVRLTVVGNEGEAEMVCSLLRLHGIACFARVTDPFGENTGEFGAWREILVRDDELEAARHLLPAR